MDPLTLIVSPFATMLLGVFLGQSCNEAREWLKCRLRRSKSRLTDTEFLEQIREAAREGRGQVEDEQAVADCAALEVAARSVANAPGLAASIGALPAPAQEHVGVATVSHALRQAHERLQRTQALRDADLEDLTIPIPEPLPPDDLTGSRLSGYALEARLGVGGFGTVYRGRNAIGKDVAIKVPHHPSQIANVLHEARAMASLGQHDHLASLENVVLEGTPTPHLICDYVDGADLRLLLERERTLSEAIAETVVLDVLAALEHAHARGVVHLDLKPENLLLTRAEPQRVVVLDFGIGVLNAQTQHAASLSSELTGARSRGTVDYVAPEVQTDDGVDGRADLYSLAVTLFELLRGQRPRGAARLGAVRPALNAFFESAYQHDREGRPASAAEARRALLDAIAGEREALEALHETVRVQVAPGTWTGEASAGWQSPAALLESGRRIPPVVAVDSKSATDADMPQLARFPALELLDLARNGLKLPGVDLRNDWGGKHFQGFEVEVSQAGLECLQPLASLTRLCLSGKHLSDDDMRAVGRLRSLEALSLSACSITDAGLAHLAELPRLQTLGLGHLHQLSGRGLEALKGVSTLERVDVFDCRFTAEGLAAAACLALHDLRLDSLTPAGARHLSSLSRLRTLHVSRVMEGALAHLGRLPNLVHLKANGGATDEDLEGIAKQASLEVLALHFCHAITGDGLSRLGELRRLRGLHAYCASVNEAAVRALSRIEGLRVDLTIHHCSVESLRRALQLEALRSLTAHFWTEAKDSELEGLDPRARLTELTLSLTGELSGRGLAVLGELSTLQKLTLGLKTGLDADSLSWLSRLPRLESLTLRLAASSLAEGSLRWLPDMRALQSLSLGVSDCSPGLFAPLREVPALQKLELSLVSCRLEPAALRTLAGLRSLEKLRLEDCSQLDEAAVRELELLEGLECLWVVGCAVTPALVGQLARLPSVQRIYLVNTGVDTEAAHAAGKAAGTHVNAWKTRATK